MEISKSYPYHSIAKKHDVDYSTILACAHFLTFDEVRGDFLSLPQGAFNDCVAAMKYFKSVQSGITPFH